MMHRPLSFLLLLLALPALAGSWAGDHGHYLRFDQQMWALNPTGEDFTVTVLRDLAVPAYIGEIEVAVTGPDGQAVLTETIPGGQGPYELSVPAAGTGTYGILTRGKGTYYFVRCSLPRLVVHAGNPGDDEAAAESWFHLMNMLPRRWWFFVPAGTERFELGIRHRSGTSGREDMAIVVYSPRGQRVRAWRGSPGLEIERDRDIAVEIPVEPTMDGRFWSMLVSNGDSHWHSDNELYLRGIPPYLAQAPEMWFDPSSGEPAAIALPHHDRDVAANRFAHHMPNTWLGDQSFSGLNGNHRIEMLNPNEQPLILGLGSYVMAYEAWQARLNLLGPTEDALGELLVQQPAEDWQTNEHRLLLDAAPAGLLSLQASGNRYFIWSDPALPTVLTPAGEATALAPAAEGPAIVMEMSGPRHWYFQVPEGTERFTLLATTPRPGDQAVIEIHAPDRLMRIGDVVGRQLLHVEVPEPLRGRRWFLRVYPGSGTNYAGNNPAAFHRPTIQLQLQLTGIPPRLSPTWGQWFPPQQPTTP